MADKPSTSDFATAAGISKSYASEILSGVRVPSRSLAITIFLRTGMKFGPISSLADEDIHTLVRIEGAAA